MKKLTRKSLNINGVERHVVCDPENDSLATILRQMGLTGTKIGCNTGVCGACSVLVDGEVVRSCILKMKNVKEFSSIVTVEGIGTPQNLHPIQQALITYGGVQCGFCTPGFVVSTYGLLLKNPDPTREEVRQWFEDHRNICRCTGYKPLVDAAMAAAKVMRGEASMSDITYCSSNDEDIYGSNYPRPTAVAKVCGLSDYGDDIAVKMSGRIAYLAPVLSTVAHARIINIDVSKAEEAKGVIKVLTAKDVKGTNNLSFPSFLPRLKGKGLTEFPVIAGKKINKIGDCVALVAADTQEHAREAAKLVKVELEILPSYMSILDSALPNAIQLHETTPNMYMYQPLYKGKDPASLWGEAETIVEGSFASQHEPHLVIEPDVVQAYWDTDNYLTIQSKSQNLTESAQSIALACGIPLEKIRMIMNPSGGSFGYTTTANNFALAVTAVQNLDIPVSLTMTYEEHMHTTGKRTASYSNGKLAVDKNGRILAVEYDIALDHGAYAGPSSALFNNLIAFAFYGYSVPNAKALARGGSSNHCFGTSYRGFGGPQIYTMSEALIDMAAEAAGIDPWEFRYNNLARPGETTINNSPYYLYDVYPELMEKAKPYYDAYKAEAREARKNNRNVGVGVSLGAYHITIGKFDSADVALELMPDGTITNYNTWEDVGQGGDIGALTHTVKALEPLGIRPEQVRLVMNDTAKCPDTGLAAASRSHYMAGNATIDAANKLMGAMRKSDGSFRTYDEMVADNIPTKYYGHYDQMNSALDPGLNPNTGEGERAPAYMYCVNIALVEVDVNTGKTEVLRFTCASDVGVIGNRLAVEGQAYGGISHSIGFALSEDYNPTLKKSGNMAGCGIPSIKSIPDDITLLFTETEREYGPHGSCGCAECYQSCNHMAVINGINDACGVRIFDLPATPEKVKYALECSKTAGLQRKKYFFGSDMEDELEYIAENPL